MKSVITFVFIFRFVSLFSQGENNEWIFGEGVHLSFKTGKPVPLYDLPVMKTLEGSTSVSDAGGNLLFYSDGTVIYDRTHSLMPNGSGLLGNKSSTSSAVVVAYPENPGKYFLFCVDQNLSKNNVGVSYNIIDMNRNYKKGDVILKNKILMRNTDEKIAVTSRCAGDGYWVVIHKAHSDSFLAYSITSSGINTTPVVSICKTSRYKLPEIGYMKFSPTGRFMVNANTLSERIELFGFDKKSGKLNLIAFDETQYHRKDNPEKQTYYGVAFSAQEKFLYASTLEGGEIFQYDLRDPESAFKTRICIAQLEKNAGAIQLGPDNQLYLSDGYASHHLHCIRFPEEKGQKCIFHAKLIIFEWKVTLNIGLPTFIENTVTYYNLGSDLIVNATYGQKTVTLDAKINAGKYLWSTGETTRKITVRDTGGVFWVKASDSNSCLHYIDTIRVLFYKPFNYNGPKMPDREFCSNADFPGIEFTSYDNISGFIWKSSNAFLELPEYGRGNIKPFKLPYTNGYIYSTITVYPVKNGFVGNSFSFEIIILPSPLVDSSKLGDISFCHGDTFKAIRLYALPYWRQLVSKWKNLDGIEGLGDSGKTTIGSFVCNNTSDDENSYRIRVIAYEAACPSLPYTFRINIRPIPVVDKVDDIDICSGNFLPTPEFKITPAYSKISYGVPQFNGKFMEIEGDVWKWFPIPKTDKLFQQDIIVRPVFKGCFGNTDTFMVRVKPVPVSSFSFQNSGIDTSYEYASFTLINNSSRYEHFEWQIGNERDSQSKVKEITIPADKVFTVTMNTINEYGCTDSYSADLLAERNPIMFVPNSFSPNDDGLNDYLFIRNSGMRTWNIRIYNSWGGLVYQGSNNHVSWDGTSLNEPCQADTYIWYIDAIDYLGKSYTFRGSLLLMR